MAGLFGLACCYNFRRAKQLDQVVHEQDKGRLLKLTPACFVIQDYVRLPLRLTVRLAMSQSRGSDCSGLLAHIS